MTDTNNTPETTTAAAAPAQQQQKNITREDVRAALADVDPTQTNSGRLLKIIGRGSLATIQKFLEELRAEKVAPITQIGEAPAAPKDLVNALWQAAYQAAQSQSFGVLATATAAKDQALQRVATLEQDIQAFKESEADIAAELQVWQDRLADAELKLQASHAGRRQDIDAWHVRAAAAQQAIEMQKEALEQAKKEAEYRETLHHQQRDYMRVELARLTDQVGELKAALYKRAEQPPAAEEVASPAKKTAPATKK